MSYSKGLRFPASKDTNPKDAVGIKKVPFSVLPAPVLGEVGLALLEGARKYGRHNYRVAGIRYSVYYDAAIRHLGAWWEGEDIDPDSGLSHITKAIAGLVVLRDAMMSGMVSDDRPPIVHSDWVQDMNDKASEIIGRYPDPKEPFTRFSAGEMQETYDGPEMSPVEEFSISQQLGGLPAGATFERCPNGALHLWSGDDIDGGGGSGWDSRHTCQCGAWLAPGVKPSDIAHFKDREDTDGTDEASEGS